MVIFLYRGKELLVKNKFIIIKIKIQEITYV